jgi:hypothetical protein
METLVHEEIDRQLTEPGATYPQNFDRSDAIAYALNRLPALYATTEEGWERQMNRARRGLMDLITMATTWGINEAQRKYKPHETPLTEEHVRPPAERALEELRLLFDREDLSWDNLSAVVHDAVPPRSSAKSIHSTLWALPRGGNPSTSRTSAHPSTKRQAVLIGHTVDAAVHVKVG